jgi:hypothetical protein
VIVSDGFADHFFSAASQFPTTFNVGTDTRSRSTVSTRKRLPSAVTSYSKYTLPGDGASCASNSRPYGQITRTR